MRSKSRTTALKVLSFAIMFILLGSMFIPMAKVSGAVPEIQGNADSTTVSPMVAPISAAPQSAFDVPSPILTLATPVVIGSNAALAAFALLYGFPGNGSSDNPFLLDRISISLNSTVYGSALVIKNTTWYFVLSNSSFSGGKFLSSPDQIGAGILLSNVQNGVIENCEMDNDIVGLKIISCSDVLVRHVCIRTYYNSDTGLDMESSHDIILCDSDLPSIFDDSVGMRMISCTSCLIENNSFSSRSTHVEDSNGNRFLNNTWSGMYDYGLNLIVSDGNLVQGNIFGYASYNSVNVVDGQNDSFLGNLFNGYSHMGIYLQNSSYSQVCGNNFTNSNNCIYIYLGGNELIYNNNIQTSVEGIRLDGSSHVMVLRNRISDCTFAAIELSGGPMVQIYGNVLVHDSIYTYADSSSLTSYAIDSNNTVNGGPVCYYKDLNGTELNIPVNAGQVIVANSQDLWVHGLVLTRQNFGILAVHSTGLLIENNQLSDMDQTGIYIYAGSNEVVQDNRFVNFNEAVSLFNTGSSQVLRNNLTGCTNIGLVLSYSDRHRGPG